MLSGGTVRPRAAVAAVAVLLALSGLPLVTAGPAAAGSCPGDSADSNGRGVQIEDCGEGSVTEDDGNGNGGGGGESEEGLPECDTDRLSYQGDAQWCEGAYACWAHIPSAVYPTPDAWPAEPPTEDSVYIFKACSLTDGSDSYSRYGWYPPEPDGPSTTELAWRAYDSLTVPEFELRHNPSGAAVVLLETWWWAEGPSGDPLTARAGRVSAVAEPVRLEADPGDGGGVLRCPFATASSDACAYTYERASVDGSAETADGSPAFPARARLVYDLRFEFNGEPLEPPGLPASLRTAWEGLPVRVTEVQANVVD